MRKSPLIIISLTAAAAAASLFSAPAKPKSPKAFEPGKPAFTPSPETAAFDPAAASTDFVASEHFHLPDDLEVTVWATSPMLFNPANMDVDHAGRIWIAEGINYRRHSGRSRDGDAIRVLQDTDGDGKADKSHVFVREKELECPLGVAVFDNVIVVSNTPDIIVYTDVDRDLVFDPAVDKREVLLTGFEQPQHDHSLHSISGGPDGRWYFTNGNCGAMFTDRSGRTFRIGGGYLNNDYTGETSDDGHVWVGGFSASVNPDGTDARIHGHNNRNSYEQVKNSLGDMFQNDNDDPPACRVSHILDGANFGFFSTDGQRKWQADQRPGQDIPTAEWRQDDPGVAPAGDVYGGGAPTGIAFYENGALPEKYQGMLLSCETGRNTVFGYFPKAEGAGFELNRSDFLTTNTSGQFKGSDFVGGADNLPDEKVTLFRPSDVCVGPDGALYVSDWFDPRTGGHQDLDESCSGAIYRIAPKSFKSVVPSIDFETSDGQIAALQSPAINTRHVGFTKLKAAGASVIPAVAALLDHENPYVAARAVWLLAQLGHEGSALVNARLKSDSARDRLVAFRALRSAGTDVVSLGEQLATDPNADVRRELAVALRDVNFDSAKTLLVQLAKGYDGKDRSYLAAFSIASTGKEELVWNALQQELGSPDANQWSDAFARLSWTLHPEAAVPAFKTRASSESVAEADRKLAIDALAFTPTQSAATAVLDIAAASDGPLKDYAMWWLIKRSTDEWANFGVPEQLKEKGIFDPDAMELVSVTIPEAPPNPSGLSVEAVMALEGNATAGAQVVTRCYMCHQVGDVGVAFGPVLTGWGLSQPSEVIAQAIIDPSKDIAHGFDGMEITTKDGIVIQGSILTDGDIVIIRSLGGQTQYIAKRRIAKRTKMTRSMMMSAVQIGLTAQDVADVVAYLKQPTQ